MATQQPEFTLHNVQAWSAFEPSARYPIEKLLQLTRCITKAQAEFILEDDRRKAFDILLADILKLVESEYGFIGEVLYDEQQQPYLKTFALTNIAWDSATKEFYAQHAPQGLEFRNLDTLFGFTLRTAETVLANDAMSHPASAGIPAGHPPLVAYLGIPVFYNEQLIAMMGLANRPGGYTIEDIQFLEPLLSTFGQLVYATRLQRKQLQVQQQLNNIVEASEIGTWKLDLATEYLDVNARWLTMLGYQENEIQPLTISWMREKMHPQDLVLSRESMLRHLNGESTYYQSQFRLKHKEGHWVWIQARGRLLQHIEPGAVSGKTQIYGINIDITRQKELENNLTKLAEHVPGMVYQFKRLRDGKVVFPYTGPAVEKVFGFTSAQLEQDGMRVFTRVHPDDLTPLLKSVSDSQLKLNIWKYHFRYSIDGEHYRWLAAQSSPERFDDGSVLWHGYIQDVTEEMELQQALQKAKEQAEQSVTTKANFLANMSHEIRTPMNGVIGMLDLFAEHNTDPSLQENISVMRESAYSLLTIIDDILDFSKLEAGKLNLSPVDAVLDETVDKVCHMLDFVALKAEVEFYYFIDPQLRRHVLIDPDRLRQILINLLGNAIKFSSKQSRIGEVFMSVNLLDHDGDQALIEITVKDNGIGMSPAVVENLFQAFTQADDSTSRKFGGTGLGLAITQQLVELMHGVISAKSLPGQGSAFTVVIPVTLLSEPRLDPKKLSGRQVYLLAEQPNLWLMAQSRYFAAAGAEVCILNTEQLLQQLTGSKLTQQVLWVFDSKYTKGDLTALADAIKQYQAEHSRFLVIGRGRRRKPRRTSLDVIYIDANVLSYQQLLAAAESALFDQEIQLAESAMPAKSLKVQKHCTILVLEDNSTNQKVIKQQLQRLGFEVLLADNGQQGLTILFNQSVDLILSDLHMPEMDGYEFIKQFRDYEQTAGLPRTPVIALTANILAEELERSKAAGMDDYLVKPLPVAQLKETLAFWLGNDKTSLNDTLVVPDTTMTSGSEIFSPASSSGPLLDTSQLAEMVGEDAVNEILQDYHDSLLSCLKTLSAALTTTNYHAFARETHKLKSSTRFIGYPPLADLFEQAEQQAKAAAPELAKLTALMQDIEAQAGQLLDFINQQLTAK